MVATDSVKYPLILPTAPSPPVAEMAVFLVDTPTSENQWQNKMTGHDGPGSTEPVPVGDMWKRHQTTEKVPRFGPVGSTQRGSHPNA